MDFSVFVNSIKKTGNGTVIEAANGSEEGPPFVRFEINTNTDHIHIGKRYIVSVKEIE